MTRWPSSTGSGCCGATATGSRCCRSTRRWCGSTASGTIFSRSTASGKPGKYPARRAAAPAPGLADAEPLHEAVADQRRIARRLDRAGLVVDLGRQQQRPVFAEAPDEELLEVLLVAHPMAVRNAGALGDRDDVGRARRRGRLLAGDLVDAVVPDDDGEIARRHFGDGGEAAERHQDRAVALERDHAAPGLRQRHAERDRAGEPHAAQHVEVLRPVAGAVEVPVGVADAGDHRLVMRELRDEALGQVGAIESFGRGRHVILNLRISVCRFRPDCRRSAAAKG